MNDMNEADGSLIGKISTRFTRVFMVLTSPSSSRLTGDRQSACPDRKVVSHGSDEPSRHHLRTEYLQPLKQHERVWLAMSDGFGWGERRLSTHIPCRFRAPGNSFQTTCSFSNPPFSATQSHAGRLCSTSRPCRNCDGPRSGARQFLRRTSCSCGPRDYEPPTDELLNFQTKAQQVHEHLLRCWYQMARVHRFKERIAFRKAPIFRPVDGAGVTTVLCPARRVHEARRTISRFCTCGGKRRRAIASASAACSLAARTTATNRAGLAPNFMT